MATVVEPMVKWHGYGTPTFTRLHEGPSRGYEYYPYHTVNNDPLPTFSVAHERPSHGYDYNPYHTIGNDPPPTFAKAYKGPTMAMSIIHTILLATSLSQYSLWYINAQANTMVTIRNVASWTFFLQFLAFRRQLVTKMKKSSRDSLRKWPYKVKRITYESLKTTNASLIYNGTRFISSTIDHHLVWVGLSTNSMTTTLIHSDKW